jgi:hypothetical protein
LNLFWRKLILTAMAVSFATSMVLDARYFNSASARLYDASPSMPDDRNYQSVLNEALADIPETESVLVDLNQAPYLFAYTLFPRPAYFSPSLPFRTQVPRQYELLVRRDIHWVVGEKLRSR